MAFDLQPVRSRNLELGVKWQLTHSLEVDAAAFRADTRNELAVATNQNGRSTYRNVGAARRQGIEASLAGGRRLATASRLHPSAVTLPQWISRLRRDAVRNAGAAGARIPGVPDNYGSLLLEHGAATGWRHGVTLDGIGPVTVNDPGTQCAAGYGSIDVDLGTPSLSVGKDGCCSVREWTTSPTVTTSAQSSSMTATAAISSPVRGARGCSGRSLRFEFGDLCKGPERTWQPLQCRLLLVVTRRRRP